jgi:hypothetical protein
VADEGLSDLENDMLKPRRSEKTKAHDETISKMHLSIFIRPHCSCIVSLATANLDRVASPVSNNCNTVVTDERFRSVCVSLRRSSRASSGRGAVRLLAMPIRH